MGGHWSDIPLCARNLLALEGGVSYNFVLAIAKETVFSQVDSVSYDFVLAIAKETVFSQVDSHQAMRERIASERRAAVYLRWLMRMWLAPAGLVPAHSRITMHPRPLLPCLWRCTWQSAPRPARLACIPRAAVPPA